jgi:hypothetical protein
VTTPGELGPPEIARRMITGFVVSQALYVTAKLDIADLLDQNITRTVAELADHTGAHADSLYRVLRLVAELGLLSESDPGSFTLTERGRCLRADAPDSIRQAAIMFPELPYRAAGDMLHTVMTGETAFDHIFGVGHESYLETHLDDAVTFHAAIGCLTGVVNAQIVAAIELSDVDLLVDVGGGHASLLVAILQAHPHLRALLLDQASALAGARRNLAAAGVASRADVVEGDFFDSVPAGGRLYLLKSVVHAWPDEDAVRILKNCAAALGRHGRLCVVERLVRNDGHSLYSTLNDLIMMTVTGGRERSEPEFRKLFDAAGLRMMDIHETPSGFALLHVAVR